MVWGVCGSTCVPEILEPLGLISYGGGSNRKTDRMTYVVYSKSDNDFRYEIDDNKIHNIGRIYTAYLRKHKLENLNDNIDGCKK